jgi:hypothetical protein
MDSKEDKVPYGNNILNPLIPDALWDLSGLFSFDYNFHSLFRETKDFYDCELPIKSIHGCYPLAWNGGRRVDVKSRVNGDSRSMGPEPIFDLWSRHTPPVGCYLTFSNHLIKERHLGDSSSNWLLDVLVKHNHHKMNGVIVSSDILSDYIRKKYPELKQKASIIKSATERPEVNGRDFKYYDSLTDRFDKVMVHPDDCHNRELLKQIADSGRQDSYELILNENCPIGCAVRNPCYSSIARDCLKVRHGVFHFFKDKLEYGQSLPNTDPRCGRNNYNNPDLSKRTTQRSCNFTQDELVEVYNLGFRHYKLQGRGGFWFEMFYDFIRYAMEPNYIVPRLLKK